jgi:hypothetical protein
MRPRYGSVLELFEDAALELVPAYSLASIRMRVSHATGTRKVPSILLYRVSVVTRRELACAGVDSGLEKVVLDLPILTQKSKGRYDSVHAMASEHSCELFAGVEVDDLGLQDRTGRARRDEWLEFSEKIVVFLGDVLL